MLMSKYRKTYVAPRLTTATIKAERGYAVSMLEGPGPFDEMLLWQESNDSRQMETYDASVYWDNTGNHFWE